MKRGNYLNAILTVNAVLLAGLVWTQIVGRPIFAGEAVAQVRTIPPRSYVVPNAAVQRDTMINVMRSLEKKLSEAQVLLTSGKLKVEVTNLDEIEVVVE